MGNESRSGGVSAARQLELARQFCEGDEDIVRQLRIISDLEQSGHSAVAAKTLLRLMEREQQAIVEELGYSPRSK